MKINHVGYAVKKIDKAINEFEKLDFVFEDVIDDTDRNVHICFGTYHLAITVFTHSYCDKYAHILKLAAPVTFEVNYVNVDVRILASQRSLPPFFDADNMLFYSVR